MHPREFQIDTITVDDVEPLAEFLRETFVAAYGGISPAEDTAAHVASAYAVPTLRAQLTDPRYLTWVARHGKRWAGCAQIVLDASVPAALAPFRGALLNRFYLRADFFGTGVADLLMTRLQVEVERRGLEGLWLSVWQDAARAIRFYERQGFVKSGVTTFAVGRTWHDDFWMIWRA